MNYLYILALAAALARLLWVRYPYPWFVAALAMWLAQAVNVSLFPGTTREWTSTWWMYPEIALVIATAGALVESVARGTSYVRSPFRRAQAGFAAWLLAVFAAGVGIVEVKPPIGDALAVFLILREWTWIGLALAAIVTELLLIGVARPARVAWHHRLLLVVLLTHAAAAPLTLAYLGVPSWWKIHGISRAIVAACCVWWIVGAKR
jgi:hypothetical protein